MTLHPPYQPHSETSHDAAARIAGDSSTLRRVVFDFIAAQGEHGATDEEIQRGLNMNPSTQRPRRVELVESKAVIDSGLKRATASGRGAVVWVDARLGRREQVTRQFRVQPSQQKWLF